jgi:hypothetical protein
LFSATLTEEGKKHEAEKEAQEKAETEAKANSQTKSGTEKHKEDVANLKAKNGGGSGHESWVGKTWSWVKAGMPISDHPYMGGSPFLPIAGIGVLNSAIETE